jgi:hypothetical protein
MVILRCVVGAGKASWAAGVVCGTRGTAKPPGVPVTQWQTAHSLTA